MSRNVSINEMGDAIMEELEKGRCERNCCFRP